MNQQETIDTIVSSAQYLSSDYVTRKLLEVLGDIDKADDIVKQMTLEEVSRYRNDVMTEEEKTE